MLFFIGYRCLLLLKSIYYCQYHCLLLLKSIYYYQYHCLLLLKSIYCYQYHCLLFYVGVYTSFFFLLSIIIITTLIILIIIQNRNLINYPQSNYSTTHWNTSKSWNHQYTIFLTNLYHLFIEYLDHLNLPLLCTQSITNLTSPNYFSPLTPLHGNLPKFTNPHLNINPPIHHTSLDAHLISSHPLLRQNPLKFTNPPPLASREPRINLPTAPLFRHPLHLYLLIIIIRPIPRTKNQGQRRL